MITSSRSIQEHKLVEESMMKSLQREKELNQLKSRFVNMTSHEFRTPLATIRSSAEIIEAYIKLEKSTYNEKITKQLDNIQSEIHRISNLISETLLIGKIESQQLTVHREEVNVIELINFAINRQNQQQKDHRITELEVVGEVPKIWLDPQHFIHILDNLISNAFKYSLGKRNPIISVSSEKNQLKFKSRILA
jgi:signal transduction histidine kinase